MGYILKALLILTFISASFSCFGSKIDRAFDALSRYDYYGAKELFKKVESKEPVASPYGQSLIYGRNDNPFFNLDSAYIYILKAEVSFVNLEISDKEDLLELQIDSIAIQSWKDSIDKKAYLFALKNNTLASYQRFIDMHTDAKQLEAAKITRNEFAFNNAKEKNSARSFKEFIELYPNADQIYEAKNRYEERLFVEYTISNEIVEYINFIKKYPNSPFVGTSEDSIYSKTVEVNSQKSYYNFIKKYPENHNIEDAWRKVYNLYIIEYSPQKIIEFRIDYPDYPFLDELVEDLKLAQKMFFPYQENEYYGFIDKSGEVLIEAKYEAVEEFSEGLALVVRDGKVGYINKVDDTVIPFEYEDGESFVNGAAIVSKNDKYGLINRNNQSIVDIKYELVGNFFEGLAVVSNDTAYGYVNKNGLEIIPLYLQYASDFDRNYALIEMDSGKGMINTLGATVIEPKYTWLEPFNEYGVARAKNDTAYGLLDKNGSNILPFEYERIGSYSEKLAVISKNGKYGYVNTKGVIVIETKFDFTDQVIVWGEMKNGKAKFYKDSKYGIIDSLGNEVFPAIFQDVGEFKNEEWVAVKKRGKWGYSNKNLRLMVPYKYDFALSFSDGYGIVKNEEGFNFIDEKEEMYFEHNFENIQKLDSTYIVELRGLKGVINFKLETILDTKYESIEEYNSTYLKLLEAGSISYWNKTDGTIVAKRPND